MKKERTECDNQYTSERTDSEGVGKRRALATFKEMREILSEAKYEATRERAKRVLSGADPKTAKNVLTPEMYKLLSKEFDRCVLEVQNLSLDPDDPTYKRLVEMARSQRNELESYRDMDTVLPEHLNREAIAVFDYLENSEDHAEYLSRIARINGEGWSVAGGGFNGNATYLDLMNPSGDVHRVEHGRFRTKNEIESAALADPDNPEATELKSIEEFFVMSYPALFVGHPSYAGPDGKFEHTLHVRYGTPKEGRNIKYTFRTRVMELGV